MAARLLQLAERHPSHLEAYIAHNSRLFLDPSVVGNLCLPALQQFAHFSRHRFGDTPSSDEAELFEAIEHALETGEVEGLARGDSCCSSDDEAELLDVAWRDTPLDSWVAVLRSFAHTPASLPLAARLSLPELDGPTLESWLDGHLPTTLAALTPTDEAPSVAPLTGKAVHAARECSERIEKLVLEGSARALCVDQACEARLRPMQERDLNSLARAAEAVNTDVETATTLEDCMENSVEGVGKAIAAREGDREILPSTEGGGHAAWCAELYQVLGRAALLAHFLCEPILEDSMHVLEAKEEVARSALLACKTLLDAEEKLSSGVSASSSCSLLGRLRWELRCAALPCVLLAHQSAETPQPKAGTFAFEMAKLDSALGDDALGAYHLRARSHALRLVELVKRVKPSAGPT